MNVEQISAKSIEALSQYPFKNKDAISLVLVFAAKQFMKSQSLFLFLKENFSSAIFLGCSTAGEINDTMVKDDSISLTAVQFSHTELILSCAEIDKFDSSFDAGEHLSKNIDKKNLKHVFCLSDGLKVNGSQLVKGLNTHLPENITITGGLAGDADRFEETYILTSNGISTGKVAVIAFYSSILKVGYASLGGWDDYGADRIITKSKDNVLYEIDGKSALELYKFYLGEQAKNLPASGLLFPLSIRSNEIAKPVVRTILAVDEKTQSITFAGDIPEGSIARFQKANFNRLIDGANYAASRSYEAVGSVSPDLAILISCVGRKMVLKERIDEEVESVRRVLGRRTELTGFYSYGEISPFVPEAKCELHNQTMTITTFIE
jgi:hypothetical protein